MSFFDGEVIAKEQLPGCIGAAVTVPPAPPVAPTPTVHGGTVARRRTSPLSLIITPDGQVLLNLDIVKRDKS